MKKLPMATFLFLLAHAVSAAFASSSDSLAKFVIEHLDVTSFPSSIGPRRAKHKIRFSDYGFYPVSVKNSEAILETKEHDWRFTITILHCEKGTITICLHDQALNGGTYNAQQVILLRRKGSTLKVVAKQDQKCPSL